MWKWTLLLFSGAVAALAGWLYLRGSRPAEAPFARATLETVEAAITTNGKIEPVRWEAARSEVEGLIEKVLVARGQAVRKGQTLATMEALQARADLSAAEARIQQANADIATLERGGRPSEIASLDAEIRRAQLERDQASRDLAVLERLAAKRAATQTEVDGARDRLERSDSEIASYRARRKALVNPADLLSARARLQDAESASRLAKSRIALSTISAPVAGTVYDLAVQPGAYVVPGALIASVGLLDEVKAIVYTDEPDLGRIEKGLGVTVTWDALPGREWNGRVESVPTQVVALGTRQVGEVVCRIANPDRVLLPGTNVNAAIRTGRVDDALTIPKEAVRREGNRTGVYLLEGELVRWRPITLGISSVNRSQVLTGLQKGDAVALPGGPALSDALPVTPAFP